MKVILDALYNYLSLDFKWGGELNIKLSEGSFIE